MTRLSIFQYLYQQIVLVDMIQEKDSFRTSYHFSYIQSILTSAFKSISSKAQTMILTKRTSQIIFSILSEPQILQCGIKQIIPPNKIDLQKNYENIILVMTLSGRQDIEEIQQFSKKMNKVYILNLGICSTETMELFKKISFKDKSSIRGFVQQNLDFFCYLNNAYILTTRQKYAQQNKENQPISLETSIDRLCSFLFSYENFSQFQFYIPKKSQFRELTSLLKTKMQEKLTILKKYDYKGLKKTKGMSSIKTKIIILERVEQISPYILSLLYGPLTEQLNIGNTCRLVSVHSSIYNSIYSLDLLRAGQQLTKYVEELASGRSKQMNTANLTQAKKLLEKAYNPNLSKQELQFHQKLFKQIQQFMIKNVDLLALQQSIGNKVNEVGQEMSGSMIAEEVQKWCLDENNSSKYQRYLGLIMEAFTVHSFWFYQKGSLLSGIEDKKDKLLIQKYIKKCQDKYKIKNLKEKEPEKDENGIEIRQKCFRHQPSIIKQFKKVEEEVKTEKLVTCELLKVNTPQIQSSGKKIRMVVYINGIIGYNEFANLLALRKDVDFVCNDLKNTKQWAKYQLLVQ